MLSIKGGITSWLIMALLVANFHKQRILFLIIYKDTEKLSGTFLFKHFSRDAVQIPLEENCYTTSVHEAPNRGSLCGNLAPVNLL